MSDLNPVHEWMTRTLWKSSEFSQLTNVQERWCLVAFDRVCDDTTLIELIEQWNPFAAMAMMAAQLGSPAWIAEHAPGFRLPIGGLLLLEQRSASVWDVWTATAYSRHYQVATTKGMPDPGPLSEVRKSVGAQMLRLLWRAIETNLELAIRDDVEVTVEAIREVGDA